MDDVVIVGAGPAGLAAAATLRARGIAATIIERGRVGSRGAAAMTVYICTHHSVTVTSSGLSDPT